MARPTLLGTTANPAPAGFVTSGSYLLDLVLGGNGWAFGKMANLVGDKSTGKTLLAIEMCANLAKITSPELIRYGEAESAFDMEYAQTIGCPPDIRLTEPGAIRTIEDFQDDFSDFLKTCPGGKTPAAYVLDSFDAISSKAEMERDFDQGGYGDGKAKLASKMFRMMVQEMQEKNCLLLIISQIRDKLNVTFGETKTRSGGHALDFYASQIVWLAQTGTETRTVHNVKRTYGVNIRAKNKKCKVGTPYRDADLTLLFNYGMDDESSMVGWLAGANPNSKKPISFAGESYSAKEAYALIEELRNSRDRPTLQLLNAELRANVGAVWAEIDDKLKSPMSKY